MTPAFVALALLASPAFALENQGDLTVSEFMAEPQLVPNYYGEWFEIFNNSGKNLDLQGLTVTGGSDDSGFQVTSSVVVAAGGFVVFGVSDDTTLNGGIEVDYVYARSTFKLNEDGDTIRLTYNSLVLDTVTWDSSSWDVAEINSHQANNNAFDNEWANDKYYNWCQSDQAIIFEGDNTGLKGTPGAANDYCSGSNSDSDGDGYTEAQGDCDDDDPDVHPDAIDGDAEPFGEYNDDADCDGVRDSGLYDDDGDGYSEVEGDCDDNNPILNPDQVEITDGEDNDCNGCIDDLDKDGDGWTECIGGYDPIDCDDDGIIDIEEPFDCGEGDNLIYPCAVEVPYNAIDDDCDGFDLCDVDGDGYKGIPEDVCKGGVDCCEGGLDCDDGNAKVNPGASEGDPTQGGAADGLDNDCNGTVDDPYQDRDGDGWTVIAGDCLDDPDDSRSALVNPAATELCDDLLDNDCNGFYNDGCVNGRGLAGVRGGSMVCGVAPGALGGSLAALVITVLLAAGRRRPGDD